MKARELDGASQLDKVQWLFLYRRHAGKEQKCEGWEAHTAWRLPGARRVGIGAGESKEDIYMYLPIPLLPLLLSRGICTFFHLLMGGSCVTCEIELDRRMSSLVVLSSVLSNLLPTRLLLVLPCNMVGSTVRIKLSSVQLQLASRQPVRDEASLSSLFLYSAFPGWSEKCGTFSTSA